MSPIICFTYHQQVSGNVLDLYSKLFVIVWILLIDLFIFSHTFFFLSRSIFDKLYLIIIGYFLKARGTHKHFMFRQLGEGNRSKKIYENKLINIVSPLIKTFYQPSEKKKKNVVEKIEAYLVQ